MKSCSYSDLTQMHIGGLMSLMEHDPIYTPLNTHEVVANLALQVSPDSPQKVALWVRAYVSGNQVVCLCTRDEHGCEILFQVCCPNLQAGLAHTLNNSRAGRQRLQDGYGRIEIPLFQRVGTFH